jgi:hypothetical protein
MMPDVSVCVCVCVSFLQRSFEEQDAEARALQEMQKASLSLMDSLLAKAGTALYVTCTVPMYCAVRDMHCANVLHCTSHALHQCTALYY